MKVASKHLTFLFASLLLPLHAYPQKVIVPTPTVLSQAVSRCSDFSDPKVANSCAQFVNELNAGRQYKKFMLVSDPDTLEPLLSHTDGQTAFFLKPQRYSLARNITLTENIALRGVPDDNGKQPSIRFSSNFGFETLYTWFNFKLTTASGTSIFSQIDFDPVYEDGLAPRLTSIITNDIPNPVNNLILHKLNFRSAGMEGHHSIAGFVSLPDSRGVITLSDSTMEMSQISKAGIIAGCMAGEVDSADCSTDLTVMNNTFTHGYPAGALATSKIPRFTIQNNQLLLDESQTAISQQGWIAGFDLKFPAMNQTVQGLLRNNTVSGDPSMFRSLSIEHSSSSDLEKVTGDIYLYQNNWGQLPIYVDTTNLVNLTVHYNELPPIINSTTQAITELPASSIPDVLSTVAHLSSMRSLPPSAALTTFADSSSVLFSSSQFTLTPEVSPSTTYPYHSESYFSPLQSLTPSESSSTFALISSSSLESEFPTNTASETTQSSDAGSNALVTVSPTPTPNSSNSTASFDPKVVWIPVTAVVGTGLITEMILIPMCVHRYSRGQAHRMPILWRVGTLGFCVCIVRAGLFSPDTNTEPRPRLLIDYSALSSD
ncbi:hypothetical protein [Endozoicomonas arenosclerae]|uniref:hypothetical protein n=1 Tax=Endozoicomonas arenosclerae TaxID=1633495 RepID=UPI0007866972|nr:hypothetical protein [Endozoicomonas arenosclerae]